MSSGGAKGPQTRRGRVTALPVSEVFRRDARPRLSDPYRRSAKYPSGTRCPDCGLVFIQGVWRVATRAAKAEATRSVPAKRCPACLQIKDGYPGGVLRLRGRTVTLRREEILGRMRKVEEMARKEHPLERIYRIEDEGNDIVVSLTDEHLASRIGKALRSDFGGTLQITYGPENQYALVKWNWEE